MAATRRQLSEEVRARLRDRLHKWHEDHGGYAAIGAAQKAARLAGEKAALEESVARALPLIPPGDAADIRKQVQEPTDARIYPIPARTRGRKNERLEFERYIKKSQKTLLAKWDATSKKPIPTIRMFLLGLKLRDIAAGTGISLSLISRYFRGLRIVSLTDGIKLAIYLGRDPFEICAFFNAARLAYLRHGCKPPQLPRIGRRYSPERLKCLKPGHIHGHGCYGDPHPFVKNPKTARWRFEGKIRKLKRQLNEAQALLNGQDPLAES